MSRRTLLALPLLALLWAARSARAAPVLTLPGSHSCTENGRVVLRGIKVADAQLQSSYDGLLTVTLHVENGTLALSDAAVRATSPGSGLHYLTGDATTGASFIAFSATPVATNAALADVTYGGVANFAGTDTLTVSVFSTYGDAAGGSIDVAAGSGVGNPAALSKSLAISVSPVNTAPVLAVPLGVVSSDEDAVLALGANGALSLSDVDAPAGSSLSLTLAASHGGFALSDALADADDVGAARAAASASVAYSGTLVELNALLAKVLYVPNAEWNSLALEGGGHDVVTLTAADSGGSGAGGALTSSADVLVFVRPVNDPPVLTVPSSSAASPISALEDTWRALSDVSVADVDLNESYAGALRVELDAAHGALSFGDADVQGVYVAVGRPAGTNGAGGVLSAEARRIVIQCDVASCNAALRRLRYRGDANWSGDDIVVLNASDQGSSGAGGALSASASIALRVLATNDAPTLALPAANASAAAGGVVGLVTAEDTPLALPGIVVGDADVDPADRDHGALEVTLRVSHGALSFAAPGPPHWAYAQLLDGGATVVMRGAMEHLNIALSRVVYTPTAEWNSDCDGYDALTVVVSDAPSLATAEQASALSSTGSVLLWVTSVDDRPLIAVGGAPSVAAATSAAATASAAAPLMLALPADAAPAASGAAEEWLPLPDVALSDADHACAFDAGRTALLSLSVPHGELWVPSAAALSMRRMAVVENATNGGSSGVAASAAAAAAAAVAGSSSSAVFGGLHFVEGRERGMNFTVRGTLGALNDALTTLRYRSDVGSGFFGSVDVTLVLTDDGDAPARATTLVVRLAVNEINHAPVIARGGANASAPVDIDEDTSVALSTLGFALSDAEAAVSLPAHRAWACGYAAESATASTLVPCAGLARYTLSLSVAHGTLARTASATATAAASRTLVASGTLAEVTAALNEVQYAPDADWWGVDRLYVSMSDSGYGVAPSKSGLASLYFNVHAVNDAPVVSVTPSLHAAPHGLFVVSSEAQPLIGLASCAAYDATAGPAQPALSLASAAAAHFALLVTDVDVENGFPGLLTVRASVSNGSVMVKMARSAFAAAAISFACPGEAGAPSVAAPLAPSICFLATPADATAALSALHYAPTPHAAFADSLVISVSDGGGSGAGVAGGLNASAAIALVVRPANAAPSLALVRATGVDAATGLPFVTTNLSTAVALDATLATLSVDEDATLSIAFVAADVDAGAAALNVSIVASNGAFVALNTSRAGFLSDAIAGGADPEAVRAAVRSVVVLEGTGDGAAAAAAGAGSVLRFRGNVTEVAHALRYALTVRGAADWNTLRHDHMKVVVTLSDNGNSGIGGAQSASATVAVAVNAINDAPRIAGLHLGQSAAAKAAGAADGSIAALGGVGAIAAGTMLPLTMLEDTEMLLTSAAAGGSFPLSVSDVDVAESYFGLLRVTLAVDNGTLAVHALDGLRFVTSNFSAALVTTQPELSVVRSGVGGATLVFECGAASCNAALRSVRYRSALDFSGSDTLVVTVSDLAHTGAVAAVALFATASVPITVSPTADAPVIVLPPALESSAHNSLVASEDTPLRVDGLSLSHARPEAAITFSVCADHGDVAKNAALLGAGGSGVSSGGSVSSCWVERDNASTLQARLAAGLWYKGARDWNSMRTGADTLRIMVTAVDINATGTKVETMATATFAVVVLPVNDAPTLSSANFGVTLVEDGTIDLGDAAGLVVADVDAGEPRYQNASSDAMGTSSMTVLVSVNHGAVWIPQRYAGGIQLLHLADVTLDEGASPAASLALAPSVLLRTYDSQGANGDGAARANATIAIRGAIKGVRSALARLHYKPSADFYGTDFLSVTVSDEGNNGAEPPSGARALSATLSPKLVVTVTPVNDAPTVELPPALKATMSGSVVEVAQGTTTGVALGAIAVGDIDVGAGEVVVTVRSAYGTVHSSIDVDNFLTESEVRRVAVVHPLCARLCARVHSRSCARLRTRGVLKRSLCSICLSLPPHPPPTCSLSRSLPALSRHSRRKAPRRTSPSSSFEAVRWTYRSTSPRSSLCRFRTLRASQR